MHTSHTIVAALLALAPLALSLPQQQTAQTAQGGVNPINGLALPGASTAEETDSSPTATALTQASPSASSDDSETATTITASASLPSSTDDSSAASSDSSSEPPNTDPNVLVWTDTAKHTVYTVTKSTTSFIPVPTMQVPPNESDAMTATFEGPNGKPTPTHDVDTFVQGYTGGASRGAGERGLVWWLLMGAAGAMGAAVL